jgi:hypothetical protein
MMTNDQAAVAIVSTTATNQRGVIRDQDVAWPYQNFNTIS